MDMLRLKRVSFFGLFLIMSFVGVSYAEQVTFQSSKATYTVDMTKFQQYWLDKVNAVREELGVYDYELNAGLNTVSQAWSDYSKFIGSISHKKYGSKAYYDYKLIQKYAESFGLEFMKDGTATVENIGRGYVSCPKVQNASDPVDCTNQIIEASEQTWKFFMSEKGKGRSYAPHYKSMISSWYTQAGFGVSIDPASKKYFFTAYYSVPTNQPAVTLAAAPKIIRKNAKTDG